MPGRVQSTVTSGRRQANLLLIGWNEYVDLPAWGIRGLRAKVDTGALTSALHVDNIQERPGGRVRFDVVLDARKDKKRMPIEARVHRRGRVRSSSGHRTVRIFVLVKVRLGPMEWQTEFNLVDRRHMNFRMLLGRSALSGRFLVDVSGGALLGKPQARGRRP